ncbi:MAG: hypothetical protein RQ715_03250 [Methylococcales bacterium]|nr:hypothetical protein [Methylococcales bacterium]
MTEFDDVCAELLGLLEPLADLLDPEAAEPAVNDGDADDTCSSSTNHPPE